MLIGKFDYIIGNPPWINWESLPEFYRNSTKQLWEDYGLLQKTKGGGLGKVKRDLATLFTVRCFSQYIKEDGTLSFIVPFNVLKSQGGAGFRNYLTNKTEVTRIHELSELYPFEGATNRTGLLAIRHGKTKFPIPCLMWSNPNKNTIDMEEELTNIYKITKQYDMILSPVIQGSPTSPLMIISENTFESMKKIVKPSEYSSNEGVNTALSGVYWVDIISEQPNGLMIKNTEKTGLKKKVSVITEVIEPNFVYPLIRGRDVQKWYAKPTGYIVLPHNPTTGKPLREDEMKLKFPKTYTFFLNFRQKLRERSIHKLWGKKNPFYAAYNTGDYTFNEFKVAYKDISGKISAKGEFGGAAVITSFKDKYLDDKLVIPDNTLMFINCRNIDEAHYLASILNSLLVRFIATSSTILHLRGHIMKYIGIEQFAPNKTTHQLLSSLSKNAHELCKKYYEDNDLTAQNELNKVEGEIDKAVATIYDISDEELEEIKRTMNLLKEGEIEEEEEEGKDIILLKNKDIETKIEPLFIQENESKELTVNISNNTDATIEKLKTEVYLKKELLNSQEIRKIDSYSSVSYTLKVSKLKRGEHELTVILDVNGSKTEEKKMLFVGAEKKSKKLISPLDKEIKRLIK
jgi:nitrate reductase NapAB chaperone NapD